MPFFRVASPHMSALTELRVCGDLVPNQAALINSIPLLETQASSEIENMVTTADRLLRYANDTKDQSGPVTRELSAAALHCTVVLRC